LKDIIAELEAKREAARQGGGEKRHASQHAKGKLTGSARELRVAVSLFALPLLVACSDAESPAATVPTTSTPQVWTDPLGRFTIDYESHGWSVPPAEYRAGGDDLVLELQHPEMGRSANNLRLCNVYEAPAPEYDGLTQEQINAGTSPRPSATGEISEQAVEVVDGIPTVGFRAENDTLRMYYRTFLLSVDGKATHAAVACGGQGIISEQEVAEFRAVLNTLHFLPESNP
jgi:hypothetical protein